MNNQVLTARLQESIKALTQFSQVFKESTGAPQFREFVSRLTYRQRIQAERLRGRAFVAEEAYRMRVRLNREGIKVPVR